LLRKGTTMSWKSAFIGISLSIAILTSYVLAYYWGYKNGVLDGIKAYHNQCFEVGGYIIDEQGQVVACKGQGDIPKEELKNFKSTI